MALSSHLPCTVSVLLNEAAGNINQKEISLKGLQTLKYGGLVNKWYKVLLNSEQLDFLIIFKTSQAYVSGSWLLK
jgi:hypothetical protein